jgi:hypothetical protein
MARTLRGALVALALCVAAARGAACADRSRSYSGEAALSGDAADVRAQWSVDPGAGSVTLALSGSVGGGWMGLGLGESSSGSMIGADIVTARFEGGQPVVEDRFVPWQAYPFAPFDGRLFSPSLPAEGVATSPSLFPSLDESLGGRGSWEVLSGAQEGGCSRVVLRRALVTGDVHDRPFTPGAAQVVLWAYGGGSAVSYHGASRGVLSIDFGAGSAQAPPAAVSCANCYTAELLMSNYSVPVQETTYACQSFEFPGAGAGDAHAIAFYPRIDNAEVVHHILVHSCANDAYFNATLTGPGICGNKSAGTSPLGTKCQTLLYGWAVGGQPVLLPQEAGVRVGPGSNRYVIVEVHFNNRNLRAGVVDKSGVAVVLTKTLRPHDAGMLVIGDPALKMDDMPPGQPLVHRQGLCSSNCTGQAIPAGDSVTIYANFMHMHAFGRQQWSNIYRLDGSFKTTIATVNFWNFEFQGFSSLARPIKLESGDMIFTHCRYDTSKMQQTVRFGEGSLNEMCMSFLAYYPGKRERERERAREREQSSCSCLSPLRPRRAT